MFLPANYGQYRTYTHQRKKLSFCFLCKYFKTSSSLSVKSVFCESEHVRARRVAFSDWNKTLLLVAVVWSRLVNLQQSIERLVCFECYYVFVYANNMYVCMYVQQ